jgi:hypothetical protein
VRQIPMPQAGKLPKKTIKHKIISGGSYVSSPDLMNS